MNSVPVKVKELKTNETFYGMKIASYCDPHEQSFVIRHPNGVLGMMFFESEFELSKTFEPLEISSWQLEKEIERVKF